MKKTESGISPKKRGHVGPLGRYDIMAAHQFGVLIKLGLREDHTLLDIGCGCLRGGRLAIVYLLEGNYFGLEPNKEVLEYGIARELCPELVAQKQASFVSNPDFDFSGFGRGRFDFILAHSVFNHASEKLISKCFNAVWAVMDAESVFAATYSPDGSADPVNWEYPGTIGHSLKRMIDLADLAGLYGETLEVKHANNQNWMRFRTTLEEE